MGLFSGELPFFLGGGGGRGGSLSAFYGMSCSQLVRSRGHQKETKYVIPQGCLSNTTRSLNSNFYNNPPNSRELIR